LFFLRFPFFWEFFQQTYNAVDLFIVGRTLGPHALAAVGCTGSVLFFVIGFIHASSAGFAIVTAQRFGAQDEAGIRKSFCTTLICGALIGGLLTLFGVVYAEDILKLLRTPPEIFQDAYRYLIVIMAGIYVSVLFNVLSSTILALATARRALLPGDRLCPQYLPGLSLYPPLQVGVAGRLCDHILSASLGTLLPPLCLAETAFSHSPQGGLEALAAGPLGIAPDRAAHGVPGQHYRAGLHHRPDAPERIRAFGVAAFSASNKIDLLAIMPMMSFGIAMGTYVARTTARARSCASAKGSASAASFLFR
jgi:hypothetical protein